jgi:hypothetical protein
LDAFPVQCSLKQGDALSPLLFNFALEYAIRNPPPPKKKQGGLELKGSHHINTIKKNVKTVRGL